MGSYFSKVAERRTQNADALAAFGVRALRNGRAAQHREVRAGRAVTVFTVGYERRTGEDLMRVLSDIGIEVLVDVRERPISRKTDFRKTALMGFCSDAGIEYQTWPELGSTEHQRSKLRETGNLGEFHRRFRDLARRGRTDALKRLAKVAKSKSIALLCYERCHDECHRSVVADLVAKELDATVIAIQ